MAEVAQPAQHDFWRPPMQAAGSESAEHTEMVEACERCSSEFIVGSRYCHVCGAGRTGASVAARTQAANALAQFTSLSERLGLAIPAFIAFLVGMVCVLGAVGVGVIFSARTVLDWQAVQLWRIEWLLGAVAAFVAGCLLKETR
jgi:hypothetical protein